MKISSSRHSYFLSSIRQRATYFKCPPNGIFFDLGMPSIDYFDCGLMLSRSLWTDSKLSASLPCSRNRECCYIIPMGSHWRFPEIDINPHVEIPHQLAESQAHFVRFYPLSWTTFRPGVPTPYGRKHRQVHWFPWSLLFIRRRWYRGSEWF